MHGSQSRSHFRSAEDQRQMAHSRGERDLLTGEKTVGLHREVNEKEDRFFVGVVIAKYLCDCNKDFGIF